jgi:hypothetical protein
MTYLMQLLEFLSKKYVWYSLLTMIFSISAYRLSKQFFSFTIISFIMIFIGFINTIYPYWLLILDILVMIAFAILEKTRLFGFQI